MNMDVRFMTRCSFKTGKQDLPFGLDQHLVYHRTRMRIMIRMILTQNLWLHPRPHRQTRSAMTLNRKFLNLNRKVTPQLYILGYSTYLTYCHRDLYYLECLNALSKPPKTDSVWKTPWLQYG